MLCHRKEGMLGFLEHAVLGDGVRDLVLLDDEVLLEDLHGVQLARALLAAQHHLAERALAQHLHELELLQRLQHASANTQSSVRYENKNVSYERFGSGRQTQVHSQSR